MGIVGFHSPPRHQARTRLHSCAPGLAALPAWPKVIALLWGGGWHHHLLTVKTSVSFSPLGHLRGLEVVYFEPMKHSNYAEIIAPFLTTLLTHPVMAFRHDSLQHFQRVAVSATAENIHTMSGSGSFSAIRDQLSQVPIRCQVVLSVSLLNSPGPAQLSSGPSFFWAGQVLCHNTGWKSTPRTLRPVYNPKYMCKVWGQLLMMWIH